VSVGSREEPTLLVRADRVVLRGEGGTWQTVPAEILVAGDTIAEVRGLDRAAPLPADCRLVDLGDRLLAPAFVNGHTHLPMAAFRGLASARAFSGNVVEDLFYRLESGLDGATVRALTRLGAYECLLSGTATVFEHYYQGVALAAGIRDVGLSAVVAPTLQDLGGPGRADSESQLEATLRIHEDSALGRAGVVAALGPHATDTVSSELWRRVMDLSEAHELPLHTHVAQSFEEHQRSVAEHGCSPIERLGRVGVLSLRARHLMVHALYASEPDLGLLDPDRHVLGLCPYSEASYAFLPDPLAWTEAGLSWIVGTDCAPSNDSMNVQKELRLVGALPGLGALGSRELAEFLAAPTAEKACRLADLRGRAIERARVLADSGWLLSTVFSIPGGLHPRLACGEIRPGARAHLVVYDPTHPSLWPCSDPLRALTHSDPAAAIEWMMLSGEFLGERGRFHQSVVGGEAYREARREADQRLGEHLDRLGLTGAS
jgi:5-methylthioadenosine/S-adenosylhomocysteine deaminase